MSGAGNLLVPWLLGAVGAPVLPPTWAHSMLWAPNLVLVDGNSVAKVGRTMLDLGRPGSGAVGKVPIDWGATATALTQALVDGVRDWADEPTLGSDFTDGRLGELPLLAVTWQTLGSLGFTRDAALERILRISRGDILAQADGALALLDLTIASECWWPARDKSPMWIAVEGASTLEDIAEAIVREQLALDGRRLDDRWVGWILRRFSWGMPGATLDEIGKEADITRERVRQIVARVSQHAGERVWPLPPILAHAIETLQAAGFREAQDVLLESGVVIDDDWTPQEIRELLRWLGHGAAADALGALFEAAEEQVEADRARDAEFQRAIRKARSPMGFVRIDSVAAPDAGLLPQSTVKILLETMYTRVYFSGPWALAADQALATVENAAQRQLAVAAPLASSEMYQGIVREQKRRSAPLLPSETTVVDLLVKSGAITCEDDGTCNGSPGKVDPKTINGWLVSVLSDAEGHVLHRETINRQAMRDGINLTSLTVYLGYSFAVRQCDGGGLYRLVGSFPTPDELKHASGVAEAARVPSDLAWSVAADGLDIALVVGSNMLSMGSVPAPAALCRLWPDGGAIVKCVCSRPFEGRINAYGDAALMNWNTLLTHMALQHGVRDGASLTIKVCDGVLRVLKIN